MEKILEPWPWYIVGPVIGLMVPGLLLFAGKTWGISGSFRDIGAMCSPRTKIPYLQYDWRKNMWKIVLAVGVVIGGFIGNYPLSLEPVPFLPEFFYSIPGVVILIVGGILVGFGTRYADGCPGPIYAQIGSGTFLAIVTLLAALTGAYIFAILQPRLPL